ncbi:MAG: hypothetical protein AAF908_10330, partial [Pseudomonadota bacterium]
QLSAVTEAIGDLGLSPADINLVSIAKGVERNAGREQFFQPERAPSATHFCIKSGRPAARLPNLSCEMLPMPRIRTNRLTEVRIYAPLMLQAV